MLLTKASEYALLSLMLISRQNQPVDAEKLSTELNISKSFLAKILQNLARADILKSFKGANGGFLLERNSSEISLFDIIESAEGRHVQVFACTGGNPSECAKNDLNDCSVWQILNILQVKIDDFLKDLTLEDLIKAQG